MISRKKRPIIEKRVAGHHSQPGHYSLRPTFFHKRPTFFHKRPTFFHKRPTFFHKRPAFFHKRPAFFCPRPWDFFTGSPHFQQNDLFWSLNQPPPFTNYPPSTLHPPPSTNSLPPPRCNQKSTHARATRARVRTKMKRAGCPVWLPARLMVIRVRCTYFTSTFSVRVEPSLMCFTMMVTPF